MTTRRGFLRGAGAAILSRVWLPLPAFLELPPQATSATAMAFHGTVLGLGAKPYLILSPWQRDMIMAYDPKIAEFMDLILYQDIETNEEAPCNLD